MSIYDDLRAGQVWRWHETSDEFCHCLLLKPHYTDDAFQAWEVLDLDSSSNAGSCMLAFFWEDDQRNKWVRVA